MLLADGVLFSVAHLVELSCRYTSLHGIVLGGLRTPVAEREIVLVGTAFIAMALDGQLVVGVIFHDVPQLSRIGCECFQGIGTKRGLVVVEIGVLDFSQKLGNPGA